MKTTYTIIFANGIETTHEADLPAEPGYDALAALIEPALGGAFMERVAVLVAGARADMFVDEIGHLKGLPRNEKASAIYRNNYLTKHPGTNPESLAFIAGPAVLFDRSVWF